MEDKTDADTIKIPLSQIEVAIGLTIFVILFIWGKLNAFFGLGIALYAGIAGAIAWPIGFLLGKFIITLQQPKKN